MMTPTYWYARANVTRALALMRFGESLNHVYSIIRQQTADGIGVGTSVRLRAKLYRKDKSPTAR